MMYLGLLGAGSASATYSQAKLPTYSHLVTFVHTMGLAIVDCQCSIYAHFKGLFPYYIISYNKQGSFQMITKDYSKGPRVVRKDYILWKIQNMQESASMPASSGQSQLSIVSLVGLKFSV